MTEHIDFSSFLPNPDDSDLILKLSPESVLRDLSNTFDTKYSGRIVSAITSTSKEITSENFQLNFTFYLIFTRHDNFSYPLLRIECIQTSGTYPVEVNAHYGPPINFGIAENRDELKAIIDKILSEDRTRNLILSMY